MIDALPHDADQGRYARQWGGLGLERLSQDVASAARHVGRTPLLSLGVVVTLALGIAATTTIYVMLHLHRPPICSIRQYL
jgi:hypothetical protein